MKRTLIGCCTILLLMCAGAMAGVSVQKKAPVLATKTFDPAAPPPEMPPLHEHEIAMADAGFTSEVMTETQNTNRRTSDGYEATLNLKYIRVIIGLRITIWVPKGVTDKVMAHEKGHQQISLDVWATAEKRAKAAALPILAETFTGHGASVKEAVADAQHQASAEFLKNFTRDVGGKALEVNNIYDEITAHGTRAEPVEADAIKQAFARYYDENPDAPREVDNTKPKKSDNVKEKGGTTHPSGQ